MTLPPHYEIVSELGRGTTGIVFKALDLRLDRRPVAIKVLLPYPPDELPAQRGRFLREIRIMASVAHPCVVSVHEVDEHNGTLFCVREFVDGDTFESFIAAKAIKLRAGLIVLGHVIDGVIAVHVRGFAHRNLNPSNILLELPYGRVKLIGFGYAGELKKSRAHEDTQALQQMLLWLSTTLGESLPEELNHLCEPSATATPASLATAIRRNL